MNDLISRQAAIDAIGEKPFAGTADEYEYEQGLQNQWERDMVKIKILPSAQPEIIRCKDCKYYANSNEECWLINTRLHFYVADKKWTENSFCSWAERKD